MSTRLDPYLTFPGAAREAMSHYEQVVGGTTPLEMQMWGDDLGCCTDRSGVHWMVDIAGDAVRG